MLGSLSIPPYLMTNLFVQIQRLALLRHNLPMSPQARIRGPGLKNSSVCLSSWLAAVVCKLRHAGLDADLHCCTSIQTETLITQRVSVRSAGPACRQRCIVASLQLLWTFDSAGIQLLLVTQNQRAAGQPV